MDNFTVFSSKLMLEGGGSVLLNGNRSTATTTLIPLRDPGFEIVFFSLKDPVRAAYACVDTCVLVFGVTLNTLLMYLIRTKTVPAMRIYSKLLLMSCVIDLLVSFWTFILQPVFIFGFVIAMFCSSLSQPEANSVSSTQMPCVDHGYRTIMINGVFRYASQPFRYAAYLIWIQLMLFFLITTMSQYVYRFCILCRNGEVPTTIFWSLLSTNILLQVCHAGVLAWGDYPRAADAANIARMKQQVAREAGITDVSFIAFVNARDFRWLMHNGIMLVIIPVFYSVIVICFVKIRQTINEMQVLKLRDYNKQVSAALLFQAILPTFEICAWVSQMFVPLLFDGENESTVVAEIFSDIPIHLVPVLNPLGTMLLVAAYRHAVLRYIGVIRRETSSSVRATAQLLLATRSRARASSIPHTQTHHHPNNDGGEKAGNINIAWINAAAGGGAKVLPVQTTLAGW